MVPGFSPATDTACFLVASRLIFVAVSFFYLLTAMHGLHMVGGLAGWAWTVSAARREPAEAAWRIALCARYWHFMLAVWIVLFATLDWVTPEVARFICGTA